MYVSYIYICIIYIYIGYPDPFQVDAVWPLVTSFPCLAYTLKNDGSIRECFWNTRRIMWRAYWGNCGQRVVKNALMSLKLQLLNRSCQSVLRYRCSRWPPQPLFAKELDSLQAKMVASMMRVPRLPGELLPDFCRRRNRTAAVHCRQAGRWSKDWFARSIRWNDHIQRNHVQHCWLMMLTAFQDQLWLDSCRALSRSHGTMTRTQRGRPCMRWQDGVQYASARLQAES